MLACIPSLLSTQLTLVTSPRNASFQQAWWQPVHQALYAGLIAFVLRLERGHLLVQFRQYAWVHLILLFVFMPSSFFVSNIFDGIIWFLLPCSLVIVNDIGAYLAGELL